MELNGVDFLSVSYDWVDVRVTQNEEGMIVLEKGVLSYPVEHTQVQSVFPPVHLLEFSTHGSLHHHQLFKKKMN